jgi:hypothetical protein
MAEIPVDVSAWSGYRGEESPRAFILNGKRLEVLKVMEQWVAQDAATKVRRRCFRLQGDDFGTHIIHCLESDGVWLHEGGADNG